MLKNKMIDDKVGFLKDEIERLSKKENWSFSDFRQADYVFIALKIFLDIADKKHIKKEFENLLRDAKVFEEKLDLYFLQKKIHYKLKYKKNLKDDLVSNDYKSILRLIEFDKCFLFGLLAQERILYAEAYGEDWFFEKLADALKKDTNKKPKRLKKNTEKLYDLFLSRKLSGIKAYKDLLNYISSAELNKILSGDNGSDKLWEDMNYFKYKWLKRHGLRGDMKK